MTDRIIVSFKGAAGLPVEMRAGETHVQYRPPEGEWVDLAPLADLGRDAEFGVSETHLRYRLEGDAAWTNITTLESLRGPPGLDGDGAGDVLGPAASADDEFALFADTSGKLLKRLAATVFGRSLLGLADLAALKTLLALVPANITGLAALLDAKLTGAAATVAEFRAGTAGSKFPAVADIKSAQAFVDLGDITGTVTLDLQAGINFKARLIGPVTFAEPINKYDGYVGVLSLTQDATGGRTAAFNTAIKKTSPITLSTAANANDDLTLYCVGAVAKITPLLKAFA